MGALFLQNKELTMAKARKKKRPMADSAKSKTVHLAKATAAKPDPEVHVLRRGVRCDTEARGHATPQGRSPLEIVVDASEGFIPLWAPETTLRWRFREQTMKYFKSPAQAKTEIRKLLGEAVLAWADAAPVKFSEKTDAWDFEIVMRKNDDCDANGCVLASAFFPDAGRHQLVLYPQMFEMDRKEQVDTILHEIGHVFGLRHFFANISETRWASEIFGVHKPFTIMNYGSQSVLTADDRNDLKKLYALAWSGELTHINGTPIKLVKPYHTLGERPDNIVTFAPAQAGATPAPMPLPRAAYVGAL